MIKVAIIGLDTSHSIEFTRRIQGDGCPAGEQVDGLQAVTCLRFATPFQNGDGLDVRQRQLEKWGVKVTTDFAEAVTDCDAIMLEINDPTLHLEYFKRCADLGKPVFLDKPLADNINNGMKIAAIAREKNISVFSCSSLRYDSAIVAAAKQITAPKNALIWGPLGQAPAGSSLVWYGVHSFEILQKMMGAGATAVHVINNRNGMVAHVDYADGRYGMVELTVGAYRYGGVLRNHQNTEILFNAQGNFYGELLKQISCFFQTGNAPIGINETLEVMGMLDAAERSFHSGRNESLIV